MLLFIASHVIGGRESMLKNIILLNDNVLTEIFNKYKNIKFAIEGHVTRYNRRKLVVLHDIKNSKNDWENELDFEIFRLKNPFAKKWVIKNCNSMFKPSITGSPVILLDPISIKYNDKTFRYTLEFYPNGQSEKGFISLILNSPDELPENLVILFKFSILDFNQTNQNVKSKLRVIKKIKIY